MKLGARLAAVKWFKQRVATLHGKGVPIEKAVATAETEGAKKFGAVDWPTILKLIEEILPLLLKLFA